MRHHILATAVATVVLSFLDQRAAEAVQYNTIPSTVYTSAQDGYTYASASSSYFKGPFLTGPMAGSLVGVDYTSGTAANGFTSAYGTYVYVPGSAHAAFIGLTDAAHTINGVTANTPTAITTNGYVLGSVTRASASGTASTGGDAWVAYNGVTTAIPLAATTDSTYAYSYTNGSGDVVQGVAGNFVSTAGTAVGTMARYVGGINSTGLGSDAYFYNGSTSTVIGLIDSSYGYPVTSNSVNYTFRASTNTGLSAYGATGNSSQYIQNVLSTSTPKTYSATQNNAWLYTPTGGTKQIGLVGGEYSFSDTGSGGTGATYQTTNTSGINATGQVIGTSSLVTSVSPNQYGIAVNNKGADAFLYTPSSTTTAGTATGFGTSAAGTYTRLGMTTAATPTAVGYTYSNGTVTNGRNSTANFISNAGQVAGTSDRFDSAGNYSGTDAYYYDAANGNRVINPTDTAHQSVNTSGLITRSAGVTQMNASGMVAGTATRYFTTGTNATGQDGYVFDPTVGTSGQTFTLSNVTNANNGNSYDYVAVGTILGNGVVVGSTFNFDPSATSSSQTDANGSGSLFFWTEDTGMQTIATFDGTGTTPTSFVSAFSLLTYAQQFKLGADGTTIYAPTPPGGTRNLGSSSALFYSPGVVAYTVPEPASLAFFGIFGLALSRRRRLSV